MGLVEILTLVFVVLKLTDGIAWSWWWVFSPMWIGYSIIGLLFIVLKRGSHYRRF